MWERHSDLLMSKAQFDQFCTSHIIICKRWPNCWISFKNSGCNLNPKKCFLTAALFSAVLLQPSSKLAQELMFRVILS